LRVAEVIKQVASRVILYELADPRVGFVTVTEVDVAPDMRSAQVKLTVLGDETRGRLCLAAVRRAAGRIQGEVNRELGMKILPRLHFLLDDSVKKSVEISRLLHQAASEYRKPAEGEGEGQAEPGEADKKTDAEKSGDAEDIQ
jgi:ribosome-binding factor A